jgi:hypothetical protein
MKCCNCVKADVCVHYEDVLVFNNNIVKIIDIDCKFYKKVIE